MNQRLNRTVAAIMHLGSGPVEVEPDVRVGHFAESHRAEPFLVTSCAACRRPEPRPPDRRVQNRTTPHALSSAPARRSYATNGVPAMEPMSGALAAVARAAIGS